MGAVDEVGVAQLRAEYSARGLDVADLGPTWLATFQQWLADAVAAGLPEPNAMVVSTVGADCVPSSRTVLLKGLDERGLVFFTNLDSRKGSELRAHPSVSALFPWHALERQVIVSGEASLVTREEVQAYFAARPRPSRIAAWASPQSQLVAGREELEQSFAEYDGRFAGGDIPAPPHWGGVRIAPRSVEFWQGRRSRMHDRLRFRLADDTWVIERLAP